MNQNRSGISLFLVSLLLASYSAAQTNQGTLAGTVYDPSGAAVPSANLTVANQDTGVTTRTVSSGSGVYRVGNLPPGPYTVAVSAPGFKVAKQTGVTIAVSTTTALDVTLQTGQASETITVDASAAVVQTQSSDISTVLPPQQVAELPISLGGGGNLRTPVDFVFLTPGTVGTGTTGGNNTTKIAGGQSLGSQILLDGTSIGTSTGNNFDVPGYTPSLDAVQEFNVLLGGMPAEYGRTSGGIATFVTKSGTNSYHGTVYEIFRNTALDANTWFNNANKALNPGNPNFNTPADKKNDYGVTLGGPVWIPKIYKGKDKTFFFFSWEQLRQNAGGTATETVPTAANRAGNFSSSLNPSVVLGTNPCNGSPILQGQVFNPATTRTVNGQPCRDPFPGNIVPASQFSAVAQNVLKYVPNPANNALVNNYFLSSNKTITQTATTIRVDQNFSSNDKLFVSYNPNEHYSPCLGLQLFPGLGDPGCGYQDFFFHEAALAYDHIFSPTLLNHFSAGYNRVANNAHSVASRSGDNFNQLLGLTGTSGPTFPAFNYGEGYQGPGASTFLTLIDNHMQANDSVSWTVGRHNLRFGVDWRRLVFSFINQSGASGTYNFARTETAATPNTTTLSGNAFASFLLGDVSSANVQYQLHSPRSYEDYFAGFIQDDFKVSNTLVLNLGLRYDVENPPREAYDDQANLSLALPNPGAGNIPGAIYFAGSGPGRSGSSSRFANTWLRDFAPRVGFAWSPDQKTALRGSYDIIYSPLPLSVAIGTPPPGGGNVSPLALGFNINRTYSDSADKFTSPFALDAGFPAYLRQTNFDPSQANGTSSASYMDSSYGRPGMVQLWTLELQRELPSNFLLSLTYLGQHSTHLGSSLVYLNNLNPQYYSLGQQLTLPATSVAGVSTRYSGFTGTAAQALRPFPQYLGISTVMENVGQATYNAFLLKVQRNFHNGFSFLGSYTWSKSLTDADSTFPGVGVGNGAIQNPFNLNVEKSVSTQDIPHIVVLSYVYELPFGKGKAFLNDGGLRNILFGGWQVGAIQRYQSGQPYQFACATSIPGTDTCTRYNYVYGQTIKSAAVTNGNFDPMSDRYLNINAFSDPNSASNVAARGYVFGNAPRIEGAVRTPWFLNEDISIIKRTSLRENVLLELRGELFNAFNRHVWGVAGTDPSIPTTFGVINSTLNSPRQVQFTARITF